ncbi:MAG: hypothetical protein PHI53_00095 [Candidatus Pacebacteria bacterium]|nr:hypothetical protein [Candidatus Paceibacterota bacterium]
MKAGTQTRLTLDKLIEEIKKSASIWPVCLLLNEIGQICFSGSDEDEEGERTLISFLESFSRQYRAIAFSWLFIINKKNQKYSQLLERFRSNPDNKEVIAMVSSRMAELEMI